MNWAERFVDAGRRRPVLAATVLLAGLGLAAYGNALPNPFLIDDTAIILQNPRVQQGDILGSFTTEYWPTVEKLALYRPVVVASFALQWPWSHEAWTFRLVNLALHVAAAVFVFLLGRSLTRRDGVALLAAALFVIHPIHTATLGPIIGRADILAALGVLAAAWLYQRDAEGSAGFGRPLLAAGLFALALFSKENAITLPGVLLVFDAARYGRDPAAWRPAWLRARLMRCYLPLVLVSAVFLGCKLGVVGALGPATADISSVDNIIAAHHNEAADQRLLFRWGTPLAVLGQAAALLVWPDPLSWDYSYAAIEPVRSWSDVRLWLGSALLAAAAISLGVSWLRRRQAFQALGLSLATYSVVSNLPIVIGAIFAERFLYLPAVGVCLLSALLGAAGLAALRRIRAASVAAAPVGVALAGLAVGGLLYLTMLRNLDYRTFERLNAVDLAKHPRSVRLLCAVAGDRMRLSDYAGGLALARQALEIAPNHWPAWRAAGYAHLFLNEPDEALACMRRAILSGGGRDEMSSVVAANIHATRGEWPQAFEVLESLVERNKDSPTAHNLLARLLVTHRPDDAETLRRALPYAERAYRLRPALGLNVDTYATILAALGRGAEARQVVAQSLPGVPPDDPFRAGLQQRLAQP